MIFFLATRPRPVTLNMKNESNTSITKFSYTVDPQGETHLQTVRVQIGVKKTSLGSTLLCVHVGKLYLHQCVCPEMQNYGQMMILGLLDTSSA